jgi:hypothetical protein
MGSNFNYTRVFACLDCQASDLGAGGGEDNGREGVSRKGRLESSAARATSSASWNAASAASNRPHSCPHRRRPETLITLSVRLFAAGATVVSFGTGLLRDLWKWLGIVSSATFAPFANWVQCERDCTII